MRFRSRSSQTLATVMQRRLIALIGGLGGCVILLQLLAQGRVPALLTGVAHDPQAESRRLNMKPSLGDENYHDSVLALRFVAAQEPSLELDDLAIDAELLESIRDNSVGIRESERDLYFLLLRRLRGTPDAVLNRTAQPIAFNVLMTDSKQYLGRVLRVKGEVRRVTRIATAPDRDLPELYEVWLFSSDSGLNPYRIVCSSLPDEIPVGDELPNHLRVQVEGYYFKRYGYATADGRLHVAPLILAKTMQRLRPEQHSGQTSRHTTTVIIMGIAGLLALLGVVWWRMRVGDRDFENRFLKRLRVQADQATPEPPPKV